MFGYIRIRKDDMTFRDYRLYMSFYCTLCNEIGNKIGRIHRIYLSYDMAFLALLLNSAIVESNKFNSLTKCPISGKKIYLNNISDNVFEYVSLINYYLFNLKIKDDIEDEGSIKKKIVYRYLSHNKKVKVLKKKYYKELDQLENLYIEFCKKENCDNSFDNITNAFGNFFAQISDAFFSENVCNLKYKNFIHDLCFNIGKYVYVLDAYDDYYDDSKEDVFNLLNTLSGNLDINDINFHKKILTILNMIVNNMKNCFQGIKGIYGEEILKNIIYFGCSDTINRIAVKRYAHIFNE